MLVVDDGSRDDTLTVATRLAEQYPNLHMRIFRRELDEPSFGGLIRFGMAHSLGRYSAIVSADGSDPVYLLPEMLKRLRSGAHLVGVSRYIRREDEQRVGLRYRVYQRLYRAAIKGLLREEVTDSTYAFRAFNRVYILALGTSSNRFNILPEMTFKVQQSGGRIDYLAGSPQPVGVGGSEKFKLPNEVLGYASVLGRAAMHRAGLRRWF